MNGETFHVPKWGNWIKLIKWVRGSSTQGFSWLALPAMIPPPPPGLGWGGEGCPRPRQALCSLPPHTCSSLHLTSRQLSCVRASSCQRKVLCLGAEGRGSPVFLAAGRLELRCCVPELAVGKQGVAWAQIPDSHFSPWTLDILEQMFLHSSFAACPYYHLHRF